jgi:hypothetical protein
LYVAFDFGFSAGWFREHVAADVAGYYVDGVAEDELFVSAFGTFNAQECAAWFGDEFIPFAHNFSSYDDYPITSFLRRMPSLCLM